MRSGCIPRLGCRPGHDRDAADAVLRAALDESVTVGYIDQHVALAVEEADHLKCLEDEAAAFVEDALAIHNITVDLDRADLAASNASVASVLGHTSRRETVEAQGRVTLLPEQREPGCHRR